MKKYASPAVAAISMTLLWLGAMTLDTYTTLSLWMFGGAVAAFAALTFMEDWHD